MTAAGVSPLEVSSPAVRRWQAARRIADGPAQHSDRHDPRGSGRWADPDGDIYPRLSGVGNFRPREINAYDARTSRCVAIVSSTHGGLIFAAIISFLMPGRYGWIQPVVALIVAGVALYLASQPSIRWQLTRA